MSYSHVAFVKAVDAVRAQGWDFDHETGTNFIHHLHSIAGEHSIIVHNGESVHSPLMEKALRDQIDSWERKMYRHFAFTYLGYVSGILKNGRSFRVEVDPPAQSSLLLKGGACAPTST